MDGLSCISMMEPERYVHDEKRLMVEEKMMAKEKTTTFKNWLGGCSTIRKGISSFYNGKSKSFTSLADAASSKELTKPESAYAKRRRNLLAYTITRSNSSLKSSNGGIAKKAPNATRNSLALAVAMNSLTGSSSSDSLHFEYEMAPGSPPPSSCYVHPRVRLLQTDCSAPPRGGFSAWRSYSHADLHEMPRELSLHQSEHRNRPY
ncbi:hypothetical protein Leryth_015518 [Lithospermum erythrorhizon]|nr:hypothetical protein Leryth_015518 [Lithospermum erythrorhizon]